MTPLTPQAPFVFPEPRVAEGMAGYQNGAPHDALALASPALFGLVSGLTESGINTIRGWLERNPDLRARLVVMVYPTCATRQTDFLRLLDLVGQEHGRLSIHVRPLERVTDRATNALCFLGPDAQPAHIVVGPTEDVGLAPRQIGHANFVFRADPVLVEAFKRYFDWLWACSRDLTAKGAAEIPTLVLPEGTEEGARLWRAYMDQSGAAMISDEEERVVVKVNPETGDVTLCSNDGKDLSSPTEELGLKKLDELEDRIARLYAKGELVSIDKLSRIPPLDAPIDPRAFGDSAEIHKGNVVRKVRMRVSIIDEKTLKEIDKRRQGLRALLTKFTFGLADNMRWMPSAARDLFDAESKRLGEEGQKIIADLFSGNVGAFIKGKREALTADIAAMYAELGRPGNVTNDVVDRVVDSLKARFDKIQSGNLIPTLTYTHVGFVRTETALASPWGQAYSLLADVAVFPRKAMTDGFFFRGLKVGKDDLIEAMNVADDALCRNLRSRGVEDRCKAELHLLSRIEKASMESRSRCELVSRVLAGDSIAAVDDAITKAATL